MKQRVITAIVALALFVPVLVLTNIFSSLPLFAFVVGLLSAVGVYEMQKCLGSDKNFLVSVPAYILAAAFPVISFYMRAKMSVFLLVFAFAFFLYLQYLFVVAVLRHGKMLPDGSKGRDFSAVTGAFASTLYITFGFTATVMARYLVFDGKELGKYLYLLPFLGAWITDTFAYFTGRLFGKHKLSPEVSPKKTVEGSIGGILFCTLSFVIYALVMMNMTDINNVAFLPVMALAGAFISVLTQSGDLIASLIKRERGIKDYGNLFPGHGGVMDRFDSVLAGAPLLFAVFYTLMAAGISL